VSDASGASVLQSWLPPAAFAAPVLLGTLVFALRRLGPRVSSALSIAGAACVAAIGVRMAELVAGGAVLVAWGNELRVDGLSALLVLVIGAVGLLATVYAAGYLGGARRPASAEAATEGRLPVFHALLLWFVGTMTWGCVTNNIVMLYVAVEATTLTSGLLVAFSWDRRALEAGYKYLMLLTIGITFALFGCVLVYAAAAATGRLAGGEALLLSEVSKVTSLIPSGTALLAVAFLVVGFGTKAGIAPFHPWLPDAHAEAPTPVSALLSGVMIKMALYALARTVSVFYPGWPQLTVFVVALGAFTMVLGILLALAQDDLKRLLAYSSVSQMGYVVVGIGLGTYLGCYGGLFHLLNHAVAKALLFLCVGAVIAATGVRRISALGGLAGRMPVTGACFVLGALAIAGFPPLNGFLSKLTIVLALARSGMWWVVVLALASSLLTVAVMLRAASRVFWAERPEMGSPQEVEIREVPAILWAPMVALAAACLALGVFPQAAYPLLDRAATVLATLGR
jgi:hydrogenase-4 component F